MGNYASCTMSGNKVVKVVLHGGEVRTFTEPLNVAELMLETPNFFVADTRSLRVGHRVSALTADTALQMGGVYILLPMKRLNSVIAAADLGGLFMAANKKSKSKATVVPEMKLEEMIAEVGLSGYNYRRQMGRSKKPTLETIVEGKVVS